MIEIHAVSVVIGYSDIFAECIPYNQGLFDSWTVVTTERDESTRELCRRHAIKTLLTDDGKRGGEFNKGRMIERGLQQLPASGWRLHIDADIVLPFQLHRQLEAAHLDERCIYGCDRVMINSYEAFQKLKTSGWLAHDWNHRVNPPPGYNIGARWVHHQEGWAPIGFFSLWAASADEWHGARTRPHPRAHGTACRTDVQMSLQFDRRQRVFLPELLVIHLDPEPSGLGANWSGRTTKPWGPAGKVATVPQSPQRKTGPKPDRPKDHPTGCRCNQCWHHHDGHVHHHHHGGSPS